MQAWKLLASCAYWLLFISSCCDYNVIFIHIMLCFVRFMIQLLYNDGFCFVRFMIYIQLLYNNGFCFVRFMIYSSYIIMGFCISCRYSLYMSPSHSMLSYHQNIAERYVAIFTTIRHVNFLPIIGPKVKSYLFASWKDLQNSSLL